MPKNFKYLIAGILPSLICGCLLGVFLSGLAYKDMIRSVHKNRTFWKEAYLGLEKKYIYFSIEINGHVQDLKDFKKKSTLIRILDQRGALILILKDLGVYNQAIYLENKMRKEKLDRAD